MVDLHAVSAPEPIVHTEPARADELPVAAFLDVLELPPAALAHWFAHVERYCERHGGVRHYALVQALMCEGLNALELRREAGEHAA